MNAVVNITFDPGKIRAELVRKFTGPIGADMAGLKIAGRELAGALKKHFIAKNATDANKLHGQRTNYWSKISRSVNNPVETGTRKVTVAINDSTFPQKVYGGDIIAKAARALTIPINPQAYGHRASDFGNALKLVMLGPPDKRQAYLVWKKTWQGNDYKKSWTWKRKQSDNGTRIDVSSGKNVPMYLLVKRVTQSPDHTALPTAQTMGAAVKRGYELWIKQKFGKN
jgi:hypothetical protein